MHRKTAAYIQLHTHSLCTSPGQVEFVKIYKRNKLRQKGHLGQ